MKAIKLDVFGRNGEFLGKKKFYARKTNKIISEWRNSFYDFDSIALAHIIIVGPRIQSNNNTFITTQAKESYIDKKMVANITQNNLILFFIYFAVRHCIPATWLNDSDQFLYPNDKWQKDSIFQSDCLTFTLFHGQNRITSKEGVNHFIPFSESQVGAKEAFASHFMHLFLQGKIKLDSKTTESNNTLFSNEDLEQTCFIPTKKLEFSAESQAVFDAGLNLWKYYHSQEFKYSKAYNPNASLYDIKAHFQGFSDKGKMNPPQKAQDSYYKDLIGTLNVTLKGLAKRIEPKVYEYGFLKE